MKKYLLVIFAILFCVNGWACNDDGCRIFCGTVCGKPTSGDEAIHAKENQSVVCLDMVRGEDACYYNQCIQRSEDLEWKFTVNTSETRFEPKECDDNFDKAGWTKAAKNYCLDGDWELWIKTSATKINNADALIYNYIDTEWCKRCPDGKHPESGNCVEDKKPEQPMQQPQFPKWCYDKVPCDATTVGETYACQRVNGLREFYEQSTCQFADDVYEWVETKPFVVEQECPDKENVGSFGAGIVDSADNYVYKVSKNVQSFSGSSAYKVKDICTISVAYTLDEWEVSAPPYIKWCNDFIQCAPGLFGWKSQDGEPPADFNHTRTYVCDKNKNMHFDTQRTCSCSGATCSWNEESDFKADLCTQNANVVLLQKGTVKGTDKNNHTLYVANGKPLDKFFYEPGDLCYKNDNMDQRKKTTISEWCNIMCTKDIVDRTFACPTGTSSIKFMTQNTCKLFGTEYKWDTPTPFVVSNECPDDAFAKFDKAVTDSAENTVYKTPGNAKPYREDDFVYDVNNLCYHTETQLLDDIDVVAPPYIKWCNDFIQCAPGLFGWESQDGYPSTDFNGIRTYVCDKDNNMHFDTQNTCSCSGATCSWSGETVFNADKCTDDNNRDLIKQHGTIQGTDNSNHLLYVTPKETRVDSRYYKPQNLCYKDKQIKEAEKIKCEKGQECYYWCVANTWCEKTGKYILFETKYKLANGESKALAADAYGTQCSAAIQADFASKCMYFVDDAIADVEKFFKDVEKNKTVWRTEEGKFNTARLASDAIAGTVLGTVGGVVSAQVIKKKQLEKGYDVLNCSVGGQKMADWGDTFNVDLRR